MVGRRHNWHAHAPITQPSALIYATVALDRGHAVTICYFCTAPKHNSGYSVPLLESAGSECMQIATHLIGYNTFFSIFVELATV